MGSYRCISSSTTVSFLDDSHLSYGLAVLQFHRKLASARRFMHMHAHMHYIVDARSVTNECCFKNLIELYSREAVTLSTIREWTLPQIPMGSERGIALAWIYAVSFGP